MAGLFDPLPTLRPYPADTCARLRANVTRYVFIAADFRHLLFARRPTDIITREINLRRYISMSYANALSALRLNLVSFKQLIA